MVTVQSEQKKKFKKPLSVPSFMKRITRNRFCTLQGEEGSNTHNHRINHENRDTDHKKNNGNIDHIHNGSK